MQASFTTKELKELGELADADVRLGSSDLELDPVSAAEVQESKVAARNLKVLQEWAAREPRTDVQRLIDLRFFSRPVAIEGDESVTGLRIERTALDASGRVVGTDKYDELAVDLVVRSVGYRGTPMPGVPFDAERNVIPNVDGRVVDGDTPVPGVYVAGWIKRGPSGIIGTNKKCAVATVAAIVADRESGALPGRDNDMDIAQMLANRGVEVVPIEGWRAIDREERSRGLADGRDRVTIDDHRELVRLGTSGATPAT